MYDNLSTNSDFLSKFLDEKLESLDFSNLCSQISIHPSFASSDYWKMKSSNAKDCGSFLSFAQNMSDPEDRKLVGANFCRFRFCPYCAWRKSNETFSNTMKMVNYIKGTSKGGKRFLFLTITMKNCVPEDLESNIDNLLWMWSHRFLRRKKIKSVVLGTVRHLEVTYNSSSGTFHPHLHCLLCVNEDYFRNGYITQDEFSKILGECMKLDYLPIIDIRAVKSDNSIEKAVAEVSKYAVKPADFVGDSGKLVLEVLDLVLSGRRIVSYSGIFKEAKKHIKDDDLKSDDSKYVVNVYKYDFLESKYKLYDFMSLVDWRAEIEYYRIISYHAKMLFYQSSGRDLIKSRKKSDLICQEDVNSTCSYSPWEIFRENYRDSA